MIPEIAQTRSQIRKNIESTFAELLRKNRGNACGKAISDALPQATFRTIPCCGHTSTIETSSDVNSLVKEFLQDLRKPAT